MIELSIIIVNYKTPDLTLRCVKSIYESGIALPFEVIIVDNASGDHSKEWIITEFPEVIWVSNSYNAGFGRANNLGVTHSTGKTILLLNSDMVLLPDQRLEECIELLEKNSETGVVGCRLIHENGSDQKSVYYDVATIRYLLSYNILWCKLFGYKPRSLDAVMGSFMMFRRADFESVDGFDEDFFMYAEELELCKRFQRRNKTIIYNNNYTAIHKHGGSSDGSKWSGRQNMLSNALLYFKVRGCAGYLVYHFMFHVNIVTNLLLFFTLSAESKKSYIDLYRSYFSNYGWYFRIPFYYTFRKNRTFLKAK